MVVACFFCFPQKLIGLIFNLSKKYFDLDSTIDTTGEISIKHISFLLDSRSHKENRFSNLNISCSSNCLPAK